MHRTTPMMITSRPAPMAPGSFRSALVGIVAFCVFALFVWPMLAIVVEHKHIFAEDILALQRAPETSVVAGITIVPQHKKLPGLHLERIVIRVLKVMCIRVYRRPGAIVLLQWLIIDKNHIALDLHRISRQADHALDQYGIVRLLVQRGRRFR